MPRVCFPNAIVLAALMVVCAAPARAAWMDETVRLSIPSAFLGDALRTLARQADLQILFDPELVAGIRCPPLSGSLTPHAALAILLKGSPLEARETGGNVVVIRRVVPSASALQTEPPATAASSPADAGAMEEIIVTSQRRVERMRDVPVSISAYNRVAVEERSLRTMEDIARFTSGVTFTRGRNYNSESSEISIRGIGSAAGAATTGVYIDDTPIQTRHLSFGTYNTYPMLFDIERVEVLRGPQGTLFGSGSEGGTIRFITPDPPLDGRVLYARAELMDTASGAPGFELGAAAGNALIDGHLGVRVSASQRREGGYVDRIDWHHAEPASENSNSALTRTARLALSWSPREDLVVTPSFFYQQRHVDDTSAYWALVPGSADPTGGQFDEPLRNGNAIANPSTDAFSLWTLRVNAWVGALQLTSNTSWFDRRQRAVTDYAEYDRAVFLGNPFPPAGVVAPTQWADTQRIWTQELRIESSLDRRFRWTAGLFVQRAYENTIENVRDPDLAQQLNLPAYGDGYIFYQEPFNAVDTQVAVFGQADWRVHEDLSLTLGLRFTHARFEGEAFFAGPVVGQPVYSRGRQSDNPVTPRLGLSWKPSEDDLFYFTLAKGYRIGGANPAVGQLCHGGPDSALGSFGLKDVPTTYGADSVWSYELGTKLLRDQGRLRLDGSLYWVNWHNIQQAVPLTACGFQFVANLGQARSRGLDLDVQYRWSNRLTLGGSAGITDAVYTQTVRLAPAALSLVQDGDRLAASPWILSAFLEASQPFAAGEGYLRLDYQYAARQNGMVPSMNPLNGGNPDWFAGIPAQSNLGLRIGMRRARWDIAFTVQNLLDRRPRLAVQQDVGLGSSGTPLLYVITARPRTLGLMASFNY